MAHFFGELNTSPINTLAVNEGHETITITNPNIVELEAAQTVGYQISPGTVVEFAQNVQYRITVNEQTVVAVAQDVECQIPTHTLINISQNVINTSTASFLNRNGYTVAVTIGGMAIPDAMIMGDIIITKEESQSNQATMGLFVSDPVGFIDQIWGKTITIDYISEGSSTRLFTGIVVIPEIDLIERKIKIACSNNIDELINNNLAAQVKTTGRYSYAVQGDVTDNASEMKLRLQTIQKSLDFDGSNIAYFNSWFAKDVADYAITASDIYYRQPKVVWQDRTKVRNYGSINIKYQYTRLYHYQRPFSWTFPFDFCTFLISQYSLPSVQMIEDAINGAQWKTPNPIIFTSVFPPGSCVDGPALLLWNTTSLAQRGTYSTVFDSNGNIVSDPDGNNVYGFSPFTEQTDLSQIYTIGANWTASTRFSQYIIEDYNIIVKSTQSITQFGQVSSNYKTSLRDDFDASAWEDYTIPTPKPSNAVDMAGGSYYYNQDTAPQDMNNALLTTIDIAKTDIYSTHRNTYVVAECPIMPYLELKHTVQMSSDLVTAKGKIQKLKHTLSINEGPSCSTEITLALFRSVGSATETPTIAPPRPSDSISLPSSTVVLGNHYGVTDDNFNGFIGNNTNTAITGQRIRTNVDEEFRVDTPRIEDTYRKSRTLNSGPTEYNVDIPNDLLEIEFT